MDVDECWLCDLCPLPLRHDESPEAKRQVCALMRRAILAFAGAAKASEDRAKLSNMMLVLGTDAHQLEGPCEGLPTACVLDVWSRSVFMMVTMAARLPEFRELLRQHERHQERMDAFLDQFASLHTFAAENVRDKQLALESLPASLRKDGNLVYLEHWTTALRLLDQNFALAVAVERQFERGQDVLPPEEAWEVAPCGGAGAGGGQAEEK